MDAHQTLVHILTLQFLYKLFLKFPNLYFSLSFPEAKIIGEPKLEVIMITVFLNETTLPWPSVKRPSSKICKKRLKTSGCAFSTSSNKITLYGCLLTCSVN